MSESTNFDFDVPRTDPDLDPNEWLWFDPFNSAEIMPIFWGPDQNTSYPTYQGPKNWRDYEPINIPIVGRFIWTSQTIDTDQFKNRTSTEITLCAVVYYYIDCALFHTPGIPYTVNTITGHEDTHLVTAAYNHYNTAYPPIDCTDFETGVTTTAATYVIFGFHCDEIPP